MPATVVPVRTAPHILIGKLIASIGFPIAAARAYTKATENAERASERASETHGEPSSCTIPPTHASRAHTHRHSRTRDDPREHED